MRFTSKIIWAGCLLLSFSQCATIVSRQQYPLYIHSEPRGATVVITNKRDKVIFKGVTPANLSVDPGAGYFSKAEYQVRLSMPGYEEKVVPVTFQLNAWYFGNIVFGGVIGLLIVDPLSGAMWKIRDPLVDEKLVRIPSVAQTARLQIIDINSLPVTVRNGLERLQ